MAKAGIALGRDDHKQKPWTLTIGGKVHRYRDKWNRKRTLTSLLIRASQSDPKDGDLWSVSEEKVLLDRKAGLISFEEMLQRLPGRTADACWHRKRRIKACDSTRADWTDNDLDILRSNILQDCCKLLPDRSRNAVRAKRLRLGILEREKAPLWSQREDAMLATAEGRTRLVTERGQCAVDNRIRKVRRREADWSNALAAVSAYLNHVRVRHMRDEIARTAALDLLDGSDAQSAAKRAYTGYFGPRTVSLDAPLSDGSGMTWIDTIVDDREHF